jgi:hypothetical protein
MKRFPALSFIVLFGAATAAVAHPALSFSSLEYHSELLLDSGKTYSRKGDDHGIKEVVPKEYRSRYQKWKDEMLATEYGRELWNTYAINKEFRLTIKVSGSRKFGAGTDDFEWDHNGKLVAATITLGKDLDKGFPDPVYYPVMNSLAAPKDEYGIYSNLLASTKLAHEIGHVTFTAKVNGSQFQKQNELMESYYKIFLHNGFNTRDPRLVALEGELGAQPLAIWEDREYWSEVNAMKYLVERIGKEWFYCTVMNKIKRNVEDHAQNYRDRFEGLGAGNHSVCGN